MSESENIYSAPLEMKEGVHMTADGSPAHVGEQAHAVDFLVPEGTPVLAAADGVVVDFKSDSEQGGADRSMEPLGNFVELKHEHDEYSQYEHLAKDGVVVNLGDEVKRGQVIGYSGATGWIAHLGPHLHFVVGKYGEAADDFDSIPIRWEGVAK